MSSRSYFSAGINRNVKGVKAVQARRDRSREAGKAARQLVFKNARGANFSRALAVHRGRQLSEYKHVDFHVQHVLNATTVQIYPVNCVGTGTGFYQRVGARINPTWVNMDCNLQNTAAVPIRARVMIVWDNAPGDNVPALVDIIQDISATGDAVLYPSSGRNTNNSMRFRTLMDKLVFLGPTGQDNSMTLIREIRFLRGTMTQYKGNSTGLADISSGAIYAIVCADTTGTAVVNYQINTRFRYTDP